MGINSRIVRDKHYNSWGYSCSTLQINSSRIITYPTAKLGTQIYYSDHHFYQLWLSLFAATVLAWKQPLFRLKHTHYDVTILLWCHNDISTISVNKYLLTSSILRFRLSQLYSSKRILSSTYITKLKASFSFFSNNPQNHSNSYLIY